MSLPVSFTNEESVKSNYTGVNQENMKIRLVENGCWQMSSYCLSKAKHFTKAIKFNLPSRVGMKLVPMVLSDTLL